MGFFFRKSSFTKYQYEWWAQIFFAKRDDPP